jgi:hypothetical protein
LPQDYLPSTQAAGCMPSACAIVKGRRARKPAIQASAPPQLEPLPAVQP